MTNVIVYQANNGDVFFKHELNAKENRAFGFYGGKGLISHPSPKS